MDNKSRIKVKSIEERLFSKEVENSDRGILALLFRILIKEGNYLSAIPGMINNYVVKHNRKSQQSLAEILEENNKKEVKEVKKGRGRKRKEQLDNNGKVVSASTVMNNISSGNMTIKTFCGLLKDVLCAKKIEITITMVAADNKSVSAKHSFDLTTMEISDGKEFEQDKQSKKSNTASNKTDAS